LGLIRDNALSILDISRHQYYHRPIGKRPGRKPSQTTKKKENDSIIEVSNMEVTDQIKDIMADPDTNYGYRKMYFALMMLGYYINHKKVYRLMKEASLLKQWHKHSDKTYARYRKVIPKGPLEVLEMDIKFIWVTRERRHAYVLSIIDTFTRMALHWSLGFTMTSHQVKKAWEEVIENFLQPADMLTKKIHVEIRNDNGPQFSAKIIQEFFADNYLSQVFTHPYTPQENGHMESFYSILSRSLENEVFWDINELEIRLALFYEKYNNERIHSSIAYLTPRLFWELWEKGEIIRQELKNNKVRFLLKIPYQQISGNRSLRDVPCFLNPNLKKEAAGPETLLQPSVQKSPSVVPC